MSVEKDLVARLLLSLAICALIAFGAGAESNQIYFYGQYIDADAKGLIFKLFFLKYPGERVFFDGEYYDAVKPLGRIEVSDITLTVYRKRVDASPLYHKTLRETSSRYWDFDEEDWAGGIDPAEKLLPPPERKSKKAPIAQTVRLMLGQEMLGYWCNWWDYFVTFDAKLRVTIQDKVFTIHWSSHNLANNPDYPGDVVRMGTLSDEMAEFKEIIYSSILKYSGWIPESLECQKNKDGAFNILLYYGKKLFLPDDQKVASQWKVGLCHAMAEATREAKQKTKFLVVHVVIHGEVQDNLEQRRWRERWVIATKDCRQAFPTGTPPITPNTLLPETQERIIRDMMTCEKIGFNEDFGPLLDQF